MAEKTKLSQVSKTELADAYGKLKAKGQKKAQVARAESEQMITDAITVASGGGLGYYMGMMEAEAGPGATAEQVADKQQIAGVDIDLLVGGAAAAVAITGMGGKMGPTVRAVGVGGLTAWASRVGAEKGREAQANK